MKDEVFAFAEVFAVGIGAIEGFPEDEFAFAVPETVATGNSLDVVGAHKVFGVATLQAADARDVTADAYMVVGDTLSSPYATDVVLAFAKDFHLPYFFGVGNSDAFATIGVAVYFDEVANEADGVAGCGATL